MESEDTIMSEVELQKGYCEGVYDVEYLIKRQAEISFKAGRKEMVEWLMPSRSETTREFIGFVIDKEGWLAKLEELNNV